MARDTLHPASERKIPADAIITVSVPGRICLFGEHQDYLRLPVITAAIDLRVEITGKRLSAGAKQYFNPLTSDQEAVLAGALINRDITRQALQILRTRSVDDEMVGGLLTMHQDILRDRLRISTPKIDRMLTAAIKAGAAGGKINGSGGGGCIFAYAPYRPEKIVSAIEREGGKAYIIKVDQGLTESYRS